uniref:NADH dehydrogenase subunit 11 n=1 Tax=Cryptomonas gyropyrenoidosa TaxID=233257 RepID=UPI002798D3A6|nr:NADH dehydrogenase subunit 11 [Cryptomonas gyropyrenoidosa]WFQ82676.1 NADH dehydrogenase subunit 11 [Cryptomonas gyropyrenoidosa]
MTFFINIDNKSIELDSNISILQACELANIILPRFCYHERLSVAGNCRMCLVEVANMPKLQVSCAIPTSPNMIIKTNTLAVKKAREGILEFLLINHPLDCPICDQGGECDLQDQSLIYGGDRSRFREFKRAVEDKNCGPLIKTVMTRCIHCTRCVRFANEIAGVFELGTTGRGNILEISTYITKFLNSELSGNVIDLCPVGALTSKPTAFLSRPWELKSTESIDLFDSIHSNTRIDTRGYDVIRVLPRLNESLNEEWISDKVRFGFDGFLSQRLIHPMRKNQLNRFEPISWEDGLKIITDKLDVTKKTNKIGLSIGDSCDPKSLSFVKDLCFVLNASVLKDNFENYINTDYQSSYKFSILFQNLKKTNVCLLIGVNPKIEGVILFYHIRKRFLSGNFLVAYMGSHLKLTIPSTQLSNSANAFVSIIEGKHPFCKTLHRSKKTCIIVGRSFKSNFKFFDINLFFKTLQSNLKQIDSSCSILNFFDPKPNYFSFYDFNLNYSFNAKAKNFDLLYIFENSTTLHKSITSKFTIFHGHHGCQNAQNADIILPSPSFLEKTSLFVNCEGRYQYSRRATLPLNHSQTISFVFLSTLNKLSHLFTANNTYSDFETTLPITKYVINKPYNCFFKVFHPLNTTIVFENFYLASSMFENFYNTNIITQVSLNMSKCSKHLLNKDPFNM